MHTLYRNTHTRMIFLPQSFVRHQDLVSSDVDLQGSGSCLVFLQIGKALDNLSKDVQAVFILEHSTDLKDYEAIKPLDGVGVTVGPKGEILVLDDAEKANKSYTFHYQGRRRYVRLRVLTTDGFEVGTNFCATVLQGLLSHVPLRAVAS